MGSLGNEAADVLAKLAAEGGASGRPLEEEGDIRRVIRRKRKA